MTAREFWIRWRREIFRGTFLFAAVLAVGLMIISGVQRARSSVRDFAVQLEGLDHSGPRTEAAPWNYVAKLGPRQTIWIRNLRGDISVDSGVGDSVRVTAIRAFRHSDPESVRLVTGSGPQGVAVCAVWGEQEATCTPGSEISVKGQNAGSNDVEVRFVIQLPKGASADLETVMGDIKADNIAGGLSAASVKGDVAITSTSGVVNARTVTGDVSVQVERLGLPGTLSAKTVTGDVSVALPGSADATVSGHTVTGDISNEFSLPVTGKFAQHDMTGQLGKGGRLIQLETVTGDISLGHFVLSTPELAPTAPPPPAAPKAGSNRTRVRVNVAPPPPGKP